MYVPNRIPRVRRIRLHRLQTLIRLWRYLSPQDRDILIKVAYKLQDKLEEA